MRREHSGFTLIELMIVLVVVAILATFALPSYMEQVRKGKRSEAVRALGEFQMREERWRAENPSYGTMDNLTGSAASTLSYNNAQSYYTLSIANNTGSTYTITAARKGDLANDPKCANFVMRYGTACDATAAAGMINKCMSDNKNVDYCWRK